jgi:hypothetical protein
MFILWHTPKNEPRKRGKGQAPCIPAVRAFRWKPSVSKAARKGFVGCSFRVHGFFEAVNAALM